MEQTRTTIILRGDISCAQRDDGVELTLPCERLDVEQIQRTVRATFDEVTSDHIMMHVYRESQLAILRDALS